MNNSKQAQKQPASLYEKLNRQMNKLLAEPIYYTIRILDPGKHPELVITLLKDELGISKGSAVRLIHRETTWDIFIGDKQLAAELCNELTLLGAVIAFEKPQIEENCRE